MMDVLAALSGLGIGMFMLLVVWADSGRKRYGR